MSLEGASSTRGVVGRVHIAIPKHISVIPTVDDTTLFHHVYQSHGVAWRGLYPILIESPPNVCRRLLRLLFQTSKQTLEQSATTSGQVGSKYDEANDRDENGVHDQFYHRTIRLLHYPSCTILLLPPTISHLDATFASVVIRTERLLLRLQTLTAWWSTLGGGYFFCRRLSVSLQLARLQRTLALQIGNMSMARQCSVNEAYNLIYAGKFGAAKRILRELENSIGSDNDEGSVTLRQCQAARLLAKRLKKAAQRGLRGYHTLEKGQTHAVDDYQRIRIVED